MKPYSQSYKWLCHECNEKIITPDSTEIGDEVTDCCPTCRSTNLSPIFHCEQCGFELDDHRSLCDVCEAEKYPKPDKIERWRNDNTADTSNTRYATLIYPDIEITVCWRDGTIFVDAEMTVCNTRIEMTNNSKITTRREVRKAIAEIHDLHNKLKGA